MSSSKPKETETNNTPSDKPSGQEVTTTTSSSTKTEIMTYDAALITCADFWRRHLSDQDYHKMTKEIEQLDSWEEWWEQFEMLQAQAILNRQTGVKTKAFACDNNNNNKSAATINDKFWKKNLAKKDYKKITKEIEELETWDDWWEAFVVLQAKAFNNLQKNKQSPKVKKEEETTITAKKEKETAEAVNCQFWKENLSSEDYIKITEEIEEIDSWDDWWEQFEILQAKAIHNLQTSQQKNSVIQQQQAAKIQEQSDTLKDFHNDLLQLMKL